MAINVKGLTIEDILDMDFNDINKLNRKDLSAITSRLVSASNKRIKRFEERGEKPLAMRGIDKNFSVKGKNTNQLRHEFAKMRNFLQFDTSTSKGWNKFKQDVATRTGYEGDIEKSENFWDKYNEFKKNNNDLVKARGSERVQQILKQEIEVTEKDKLMSKLLEDVERGYTEEELKNFEEENNEDYEKDKNDYEVPLEYF